MKKVDVLAEDLQAFDTVLDEVKTMVKTHERELKKLTEDFAIHRLTTPAHNPAFDIWEMYNAGPTGWRCARNHPGYFEFKVGAKIIFGCSTCGVSFEMVDHRFEAVKKQHTRYSLPVPPRL